jgi:hypothetical protein
MTPPTVVNIRHQPCDLYIGRPSKLGNPFRVGDHGRAAAVEKYREYLLGRPDLLEIVKTLGGKRLGCYCAPLPCHGDVIVQVWRFLHPK